jgi:phage shock protein C
MHAKRLAKTRDKWVDGVVGGLARYFDWNPDAARLVVAVLILGSGGAVLLAYLVLALLMPAPGPGDLEWTGRRIQRQDGPMAGVCGGIAAYFDWDPTLIRLVWLVAAVVAFVPGLIYLLLAIIMPKAR